MKGTILFVAMHFMLSHKTHANKFIEKDSLLREKSKIKQNYLNVLDGGQIGVLSNGNLRSTTNILKFNVGHPKKFYLPFYLNVGANINLSTPRVIVNENAAVDLLNNMGGVVNFGVNGTVLVNQKSRTTRFYSSYHFALKSIAGIAKEDALSEKFLSKVISVGIAVKSEAWNPTDPNKKGSFWIKNSISISDNPSASITKLWGENANDIFISHSLEAAIKLNGGIDLKFSLFHFLNNRNLTLIDSPVMKLGTNVQF